MAVLNNNKIKFTKRALLALPSKNKPYCVYDLAGNGLRLRVAPGGTKSYQVTKRVGGKVKFVTLGKLCDPDGAMLMHPEQAQKKAREVYSQLSDGIDVTEQKREAVREQKRQRALSLGVFIEERYKPWAIQHHNSASKNLSSLRKHFDKWFDKPMTDINPWLVGTWRTSQLKKERKPSGINRNVATLRGVLSRAKEWGVLDSHPLEGLKPLKVDKNPEPRFLDVDEEQRLRTALDERQQEQRESRKRGNRWRQERGRPLLETFDDPFTDYLKPMVLVAMNTGLRRGELFNLSWDSVNLKNRLITVRGSGAKSGQTRHVPLNEEAFATLAAWHNQTESSELVFPNPETGKVFDNIQTSWSALLEQAKLDHPVDHPKHFTFHDLRHVFASKLVMRGASLYDVMVLLGHQDTKTTLIYAHLMPEHMADVVALLN